MTTPITETSVTCWKKVTMAGLTETRTAVAMAVIAGGMVKATKNPPTPIMIVVTKISTALLRISPDELVM